MASVLCGDKFKGIKMASHPLDHPQQRHQLTPMWTLWFRCNVQEKAEERDRAHSYPQYSILLVLCVTVVNVALLMSLSASWKPCDKYIHIFWYSSLSFHAGVRWSANSHYYVQRGQALHSDDRRKHISTDIIRKHVCVLLCLQWPFPTQLIKPLNLDLLGLMR